MTVKQLHELYMREHDIEDESVTDECPLCHRQGMVIDCHGDSVDCPLCDGTGEVDL